MQHTADSSVGIPIKQSNLYYLFVSQRLLNLQFTKLTQYMTHDALDAVAKWGEVKFMTYFIEVSKTNDEKWK